MKPAASFVENFDASDIPQGWRVNGGGQTRLAPEHFKVGSQSLRWEWADGGSLFFDGLALPATENPRAGMTAWVYCEEPVEGRLTFRLGSKAQLAARAAPFLFRFGLNFTGWRMLQIQFQVDARTELDAGKIEALEISPPESAPKGCVFLDAITITQSMSSQRSADFQIPEFSGSRGNWCQHWPLHFSRQKPVVPLPETITPDQIRDFRTIRHRYFRWLLGESSKPEQAFLQRAHGQLETYIQQGWQFLGEAELVQDAKGNVLGPGLIIGRGKGSFHHLSYNILMPLVMDYKLRGNLEARDEALRLFDYMHDQGWAEGSSCGSMWLNPLIIAAYCHAVALMREELRDTHRLDHAERAVKWYQFFGKTFSDFDGEYEETNADALRTVMFTSLVTIVMMEDSAQKVQYMTGWRKWFNTALEISPRFAGLIKPDGLGFHHHGVYAGAYSPQAFEFSALIAWLLHGTQFVPADQALENLRHALITQDVLSHKYDVPYTTMGRMPGQGPRMLSAYAYLALAADDPDPELTGIFMRLWDPDEPYLQPMLDFDLDGLDRKFLFLQTLGRLEIMQELADRGLTAKPAPEGFWSKPWGALAIHRRSGWLVSVKGWSQYVWDFEMHPKVWAMAEENVFARYWSNGTLQAITNGEPATPVASGWKLDQGWDWCRWPGATSPHLLPSEIYDPTTTWATRFFSTETFVGAVSSEGRNGLFALKLHEHFHDPTFRAFKTYFFFDNEVICLGSNIESRDPAHSITTTLFQSWMPSRAMPIRINNKETTDFPFQEQGQDGRPWTLMDPYGNGYFVPNARDVRVRRDVQTSRDAWNRGETKGDFSTCWLDHGTAPADDGYGSHRYEFVFLVQPQPEQLAAYADAPPYRVLQQNHQAHILEHSGQTTMGYALFETDWIVPHGIVRKTDTPVMVMVKQQSEGILLSLAEPDLRLPKRRNMAYLDEEANATLSKPSTLRVELRGNWSLREPNEDVQVCGEDREVTALEFRCANGATRAVHLDKHCTRRGSNPQPLASEANALSN